MKKQLKLIAEYYQISNIAPAFSEDILKVWLDNLSKEDRDLIDEYFSVFSSVKREFKRKILQ